MCGTLCLKHLPVLCIALASFMSPLRGLLLPPCRSSYAGPPPCSLRCISVTMGKHTLVAPPARTALAGDYMWHLHEHVRMQRASGMG